MPPPRAGDPPLGFEDDGIGETTRMRRAPWGTRERRGINWGDPIVEGGLGNESFEGELWAVTRGARGPVGGRQEWWKRSGGSREDWGGTRT